ncbi:hypothetical protein [Nostoc sp.]|uniref:hypothetical protein n=1 Tax=Nostoc sp. TaxID=1180 RepID=UPI002FF4D5D3
MIISIPKPQRDEKGKIRGEFYPLQRAELLALRDSGLGRGPFYIHLCMRFENPWCDRPFKISPRDFCNRWQVSESKFYRSISELKKKEILSWESSDVFFCWTTPHSKHQFPIVNETPHSGNETPHSGNEAPHSGNEAPHSGNEAPHSGNLESPRPLLDSPFSDEPPQTIQTYSDLKKTLSDEKEREKFKNNEVELNNLTSLIDKTGFSTNDQITHEDNCSVVAPIKVFPAIKYDAALGIKPPLQSDAHWALIYDGDNTPWLEPPKGKQIKWNQTFLRWQGERWMQKYSKADIYEAIADFRASLLNNPERIVNRWQEYQDHMTHHAVVAQVRIENGIELTQTETKKLQTHHRAIEIGFSNHTRDALPGQQTINVPALPSIDIPMDGKELAENPQAYAPIAIAPEERDFWRNLTSSTPKPDPDTQQPEITQQSEVEVNRPTSVEMTAKIQRLSQKMTIGSNSKKQVEIPIDEAFETTFVRMRELIKRGNPWHRKQALDWAFDNCKQVRTIYEDKFKLAVDIELIEVDF